MRSSSTAEAIAVVMALLNVAAHRGPVAVWGGFQGHVVSPGTTLRDLARIALPGDHEDVVRAVCSYKMDGPGSSLEGNALDVDVTLLAQQNLTCVKFALKYDEPRCESVYMGVTHPYFIQVCIKTGPRCILNDACCWRYSAPLASSRCWHAGAVSSSSCEHPIVAIAP